MAEKKYKAKPLYYHPSLGFTCKEKRSEDAIYFDSTFEYRVFRALVNLAGFKHVRTQVPLLIKPSTNNYPALHWKCDFRVYKPSNTTHYVNVEAKGLALPQFKRNLQYLEYFSREEYDKLIIVGSLTQRMSKQVVIWHWRSAINFLRKDGYHC